jgi:N-hydroxyarylamine O-acetyltransferase
MAIDLDAYLERIGWSEPVKPDLDTVDALVSRHTAAIPFENLDPLLGVPVELLPEALERKLVREGRGGYCFEHNLMFGHVLETIGLEVSGLAARVLWGRSEDAITPRTHMLLRLDFRGETYLVDVGFGVLTLTGLLRLAVDIEQPTPHEAFRLVVIDAEWRMQARVQDAWRSLYRFDLQRVHLPDYEVANHYTSTHPRSPFVSGLMAARAPPRRRLALANNAFTVHQTGGESTRRILRSATEIAEVLADEFLVRLPRSPRLAARLDALVPPGDRAEG